MKMIEKVAKAIENAGQQCPYGLYDYSGYPGEGPPHVVKDERRGEVLFASSNAEKAEEYWRNLSQAYVARAAIEAMREPTPDMNIKGGITISEEYDNKENATLVDVAAKCYSDMIDAALKE